MSGLLLLFPTSGGAPGTQALTPTLVSNTSSFYAPTVGRGAVGLTPTLYSNTNAFYAPTVGRGAVGLTPALYSNASSFFGPTVASVAPNLSPGLYVNTSEFPAATVTVGGVFVLPGLYSESPSFFAHSVAVGPVGLLPSLFSNESEFFGGAVEVPGAPQGLDAALFSNESTVYNHTAYTPPRLAPPLEPAGFRPKRAASAPAVSKRSVASWRLTAPVAGARIVIAASPQFTSCRVRCRTGAALEPYTGLTTAGVSRRARSGGSVRRPVAAGVAPFIRTRGFVNGTVAFPGCGAGTPEVSAEHYSHGLVLPPTCVRNLMSEMMMLL